MGGMEGDGGGMNDGGRDNSREMKEVRRQAGQNGHANGVAREPERGVGMMRVEGTKTAPLLGRR
jgi:hypothetical protein